MNTGGNLIYSCFP